VSAGRDIVIRWEPGVFSTVSANAQQGSNAICREGLPGLKDGNCGEAELFNLRNTMSPCSVDDRVSCIKGLDVKVGNGKWQPARYRSPAFLESNISWKTVPEVDVGPSNNSSIYLSNHDNGAQYLWHTRVAYRVQRNEITGVDPGPSRFEIEVVPVKEIRGSTCPKELNPAFFTNLSASSENCYIRTTEPDDFNLRMTLSLRHEPRGWIATYLENASTKIVRPESGSNKVDLIMEGRRSILPGAEISLPQEDRTRRAKLCESDAFLELTMKTRDKCLSDLSELYGLYFGMTGPNRVLGWNLYLSLLDLFPELDRASIERPAWAFSVPMNADQRLSSCRVPQGIYGIAGGNAMVVSEEVPSWNERDASLEFQVAAPHLRKDGEVASGFYEMQLNVEVAQCLWGVEISASNVKLSVISENGKTKIATVSVIRKNNMVIFRASGFSYSASTLKVTLLPKSSRLRCEQGSVTRIAPQGTLKCPKGWKPVRPR